MKTKTRNRVIKALLMLAAMAMNVVIVFVASLACMVLHVELTLSQIAAIVILSSMVCTFGAAFMIEAVGEDE